MSESGSPLPPLPKDIHHPPELLHALDSDKQALHRLVCRAVPQDEIFSVIETVVSNVKAADIVEYLQENDAQTFIDIIDQARHYAFLSLEFVPLTSVPTS